MFQLDLKNRKSIYEQVVDNLKELIITGVINPEDKLPSVRDLSKQLTVNPNTIQKAYRSLEMQGYIYTVTGLGTFALRPAENKIDEGMVLTIKAVSYTHLRAHETRHDLVCRLLLEKK